MTLPIPPASKWMFAAAPPAHLALANGPEGEHPCVTIISNRNTWKIHLELNTLSLPPSFTQDFAFLPDGSKVQSNVMVAKCSLHTLLQGLGRNKALVRKGSGIGKNAVGGP